MKRMQFKKRRPFKLKIVQIVSDIFSMVML